MCDLEDIGTPSIFKLIRKTATLVRMLPTLTLRCEENVTRWKWKSPLVSYASVVFIITDKSKTSRGGGKRCRCYERRRAKAGGN